MTDAQEAADTKLQKAVSVLAEQADANALAMWGSYCVALERAVNAKSALCARLAHGVPEIRELPGGGYDGMVGIKNLEVRELIDAFVVQNRLLYSAAQTLCDCLELADDGEAEGVEWEVRLTSRRD